MANALRKSFAGLKAGKGTTSVTYRAAWKVACVKRPFFIFSENVEGLNNKSREQVIKEFEKLGYVMVVCQSDGQEHGLNQRRVRVDDWRA